MGNLENAIADCVHRVFDDLPHSRKPRLRADGHEWVPLSGIVLTHGRDHDDLTCVALGTGMGCLPSGALASADGIVLHDWHAEILAIRAFNLFLAHECHGLVSQGGQSSSVVRLRTSEVTPLDPQIFSIKDDVKIYLYSSEAPCGDASMHLTVSSSTDATPWPLPQPTAAASVLHGRDHFSLVGVVRTKPYAPPTASKSCSDKLALHSVLSLLSSPLSLLVHPSNAYLDILILPTSQHSPTASDRAFSATGRLSPLAGRSWPGGYIVHPLTVRTTTREFAFSRRAGGERRAIGSDITTVSVPTAGLTQTLTKGRLRGRRAGDRLGGSIICRRAVWKAVRDVLVLAHDKAGTDVGRQVQALAGGESEKYRGMKLSELLQGRREIKADLTGPSGVLKGWGPSQVGDRDDGWSLHIAGDTAAVVEGADARRRKGDDLSASRECDQRKVIE